MGIQMVVEVVVIHNVILKMGAGLRVIGTGRLHGKGDRLMIKRLNIAVLLILFLTSSLFASGGEQICKKLDINNVAYPTASVRDFEGNIIVAGYKSISMSDESFYIAKISSDCSGILWSYEENPSNQSDRLVSVTTDFEGNVIAVGYILYGSNFDIKILKLNKETGSIVWTERYNGLANLDDFPVAVKVDSVGNVYVAGYSRNTSGNDDFLLIKYSKNGGLPLWVQTFNSAYNKDDRATSLDIKSDSVIIAGYSDNGSDLDMLLIKYALTGELLWSRRYIGNANNEDRAVGVKIDDNGDVLLTGFTTNSNGNKDIYIGKYFKDTGVPIWEKIYNGGYDDEPYSIAIGEGNNVYLTGYTWTIEHHTQLTTMKISSLNGEIIWQRNFSLSEDITSVGIDITVENEEDVYVTGYLVRGTNYNILTLKYHKILGNQVWSVEYDGDAGKNDRPIGIFIGLDGKVIVAGWSETGINEPHFLILKYEPGSINAPTNLTAEVLSNSQVRLSWSDNSNNEDSFKIERKTGDLGNWQEIASLSANTINYIDNSVSANTKYYYRVRAYSTTFGYSHYSNETKVITTVITFEQPTWVYTYNGSGNNDDYANAIAIGPDSNPVIAGFSFSSISGFDYVTMKLNRSNGALIWSRSYDDPENDTDIATCIDVDNNNDVIVSGFASLFNPNVGYNTNDIMTIKYSSNGALLWSDAFSGPGNNDDRSVAISVSKDASGNPFILGYGKNASGNDDIYLIKYNASGTRQWSKIYNGGGDDYPSSFVIDKNGDVIIAGYVTRGGNFDWYVSKYKNSDGTILWTYFYDEVGLEDKALSITADKNGDIFVTGFISKSGSIKDIQLIKLSGGSGGLLWQKKFNRNSGDNEAIKVLIDPVDGDIVIAGSITSIEGDKDIYTAKFKNSDGSLIWERTVSRLSINDILADAVVDISGNVCLGGNSGQWEGQDIVAIKFDHEGNLLGASLYNGVANRQDGVEKIAVNRFGETFLVGYTTTANGDTDFLIFKCGLDPIQVPTPLSVTASYNSLVINWVDNSFSELGYRIERKTGPCSSNDNFQVITQTPPNVTSYSDTNLPVDTTFCYRVLTLGPNNVTSREDVVVEGKTLKPQSPSITNIQALNTTTVKIDWLDNTTEESGFRIERCLGANCNDFAFLANVSANTTTYNDTTVCNGQTYRYRIYAYKTGYWSTDFSNIQNITLPQPSSTFTASANALSESSVKIDWADAFSDETGFVLERCEGISCNDFSQIGTVTSNITTYTDNSVMWGRTYRYRVRAYKTTTCSWLVYSNIVSATTDIQTPSSLSSSEIKTTSVKLTWTDKTSTETGFKVYRCMGTSCSDFQVISTLPANTTSYTDTSICQGGVYRYYVTAYKSSEWESLPSNIISVTASTMGNFTTFSVERISEIEAQLSFAFNSTDFDGFKIERCDKDVCNESDFYVIKTLTPNYSKYMDIVGGDRYYNYRIKAYKNATCGWERVSSTKVIYMEALQPSGITATSLSTNDVKISWIDNTKFETGFKIERCEGANCSDFSLVAFKNPDLTTNNLEFIDSNTCQNTTYKYRVKAFYDNLRRSGGGCWKRRAKVNITNFAEDSQIKIVVTKRTGMRDDFGDLRFFDVTENVEIPYMIESSDGTNLTVWIKTGKNNNIYMYYDNPLAESPGYGGKRVFEFFDHFSGTSLDTSIWQANSSSYTVANSELIIYSGSIRTKDPLPFSLSDGFILEGKIKYLTNSETYMYSGTLTGVSSPYTQSSNMGGDATVLLMKNSSYTPYNSDLYYFIGDGSTYSYNQGSGSLFRTNIDTWYIFSEKFHPAGLVISRDYVDIFTKNFSWAKNPVYITLGEFSGNSSQNIQDTSYDWVRIRKFFASEPAVTFGSEEYNSLCFTTNVKDPWEKVSDGIVVTTLSSSAPSITATGVSEANIRINITDTNIDETGFRVYRCEGSGCNPKIDGALVGTAPANSTSYLDTVATGTYTYLVEVYKDSACGWVRSSNTTTASTVLPPAPSSLTGTAVSTTEIKINWIDNTGSEDGFKIYRCTGAGCSDFTLLTTVGSNIITYTDNVCKNSNYKYKVRAYKEGAWETDYSNEVSVTTSDITPPVLTLSKVSEISIKLDWTDTTTDESGFKVERCDLNTCNDNDFNLIATLSNNTITYTDIVPITNKKYTYRIRAFKTASCGWEVVSATKEITLSPTAPSLLSGYSVNTTRTNLTWLDSTATETGFQIYRCEGVGCNPLPSSEGGVGTLVDSIQGNIANYQDNGVCRGTTYGYKVRAINEGLSNGKGGCWTKRRLLNISNFQPNFQVKVIINYQTGMQSDFDDLRFYDVLDNLELPYFIESKTDGVSAVVWIKTGRNNNIYMYYGNPNAISSSDGFKVFEFFEDFEDGNYDGWTAQLYNTSFDSVSIVTGSPYGVYRVRNYHAGTCGYAYLNRTITLPSGKYVLNLKTRYDYSGSKCDTNNGVGYLLNFGNTCRFWYLLPNENNSFCSSGQVNTGWSSTAQNTEISGEFIIPNYFSGDITSLTISARVLNSGYTLNLYTDNISVRKYASIEPTVNFASEETSACYTFNNTWVSGWSNTAYISTPNPITPNLTLSRASETQVNINWTDGNNDESGFEIWRCTGAGCDPKSGTVVVSLPANTTSYSNTSLSPMTTYRYLVTVYKLSSGCPGGRWSIDSNIAEITTSITPPSSLTATANNTTQISLSWTDNSSTELGFRIYRCIGTNCNDYTLIGTATANATSYIDNSVCKNTIYRYKITAYGSGWETGFSNEVSVTTPNISNPSQPTIQVVNHSQLNIIWNDNYNDETGFKLQRCVGTNCQEINLSANVSSYSDTGLNSFTEYCYSIKAYKNSMCSWETSYSQQVCARTLLIPPIILNVQAPASNKIIVSWLNPNPIVEGFDIEVELWNGKWVKVGRVYENYTTFTDRAGIQPQTTYKYRVKAFIGNSYSLPSAPVSVTTPSYNSSHYICE
ncbi:MAG: DUF2341 domain-containing protein [Proteobacteria bacterium]|nr:DUF2341 domain-containing protein [Pseudomonadota bacterium]